MADKQPENIANAPDPEEDDLDDLDDVLDEFQPQPKAAASSSTAPAPSDPGRPTESKDAAAPPGSKEDDALAAQLQSGMQNLMSELDSNPEMQAEFEKMMQELIAASGGTNQEAGEHLKAAAAAAPKAPEESKPKSAGAAAAGKKGGDDFNETIRKTMERMQASDTKASTSSSANAGSEDELLAQMMQELSGEGGDGDFNTMLMNMMAHLTNKEILYDPMKELHDKFPDWMAKNKDTCGKEDLARYEEQQKLVGEIVGRFEKPGYSDDNEEDREYIVERMQKASLSTY